MGLRLKQAGPNVPAAFDGFKTEPIPVGNVPADALPILLIAGNHGGDVIALPAPGQLYRQVLGKGGLTVLCPTGDKDNHFVPSTVNLSPSRISSR